MSLADFPPRGGEPIVVREDPDLLVVRKPAGMHTSSGPASGTSEGPTLLDWMALRYPETAEVAGRNRGEGGLLHRLDRETSGLVLFARTEAAFRSLSEAAARGGFRKEYVLLARPSSSGLSGCRPERSAPAGVDAPAWLEAVGDPSPEAADRAADLLSKARESGGALVESLFRPFGPGAARVACAAPGAELGKKKGAWGPALYRTEVLEAVLAPAEGRLELQVALIRGFRHQIRAHLAWIGLPLLGDPSYGGEAADRLFLHAAALDFPHPGTGLPVRVEG